MNYTKGEWTIDASPDGHWWQLTATNQDGSKTLIAQMPYLPNAQLTAVAPEMYEALKAQHQAIDILFAMLIQRDKAFFPSKSGQPWEAIIEGNRVLAKAEGRN